MMKNMIAASILYIAYIFNDTFSIQLILWNIHRNSLNYSIWHQW